MANSAGLRISSKGINLHILLELLHVEAIQVDLFTKMLQQGQTLRRERKSFKLLNEKLFNYWDKFNEHHLTTEQLLEKVAEMYTNFNAIKYAKNVIDSRSVELEH